VIEWDAERVAEAAGARVVRRGGQAAGSSAEHGADSDPRREGSSGREDGPRLDGGPRRVGIDSREVQPGDLFVGLPGERVDGGGYAEQALRAGAWGVMVAPEHARALAGKESPQGAVLAHPDPLAGMQSLARAWRRDLTPPGRVGPSHARVVAVTGSTGKTSTKDILAALLRGAEAELGGPTVASRENLNTEIGLPLAVLAAPSGTGALVLEMAMRGPGQIAQLTAIAEPDVGVIVNVGPVHLEQLGSLEAVAAAKAELIAGMAPGATVVVPAGEPLLERHLRGDLRTVTFGEGGDVELVERRAGGEVAIVDHGAGGERIVVTPSFGQSHNLRNLLAAVAAARALGVTPTGRLEVEFSSLRGERIALANGIVLINDCYNANPMSMRAALDDLAESAPGRRVAVLGDMLELGEQERRMHREVGAYARARGVQLLVAVGPLAAEMGEEWDGPVYRVPDAGEAAALLRRLLRAGDRVLVKGSRGVGLERVAQTLLGGADARGLTGSPEGVGSGESSGGTRSARSGADAGPAGPCENAKPPVRARGR
jgi:UDP-N-acetylmuramoyl-tripeptide--D-alanyl-D-alanine ligase